MKNPVWTLLRWYITAVVFLIAIAVTCSSCEILKSKRSSSKDSTTVKTTVTASKDSLSGGNVKKEETVSKDDREIWREIIELARNSKDTSITSIQPIKIIREYEKGTKEETKNTSDSSWFINLMSRMAASMDSLSVRVSEMEKTKHSETKGLGMWSLILILGGFLLLTNGLQFLRSKYTITKK